MCWGLLVMSLSIRNVIKQKKVIFRVGEEESRSVVVAGERRRWLWFFFLGFFNCWLHAFLWPLIKFCPLLPWETFVFIISLSVLTLATKQYQWKHGAPVTFDVPPDLILSRRDCNHFQAPSLDFCVPLKSLPVRPHHPPSTPLRRATLSPKGPPSYISILLLGLPTSMVIHPSIWPLHNEVN